jgi:16S rRNA processing protein RimM
LSGELITIGVITTAQGTRGEVRVYPLTDFPDRFRRMQVVTVDINQSLHCFHLETVRYLKQMVIIKFKEVSDMNAALALKGALLKIDRDQVVPLPQDHYYFFEIIGLSVYEENGEFLGEIVDIQQTGSNDIYLVRKNGKDLLIPALKTVVRQVDLVQKRITVALMPGLRELEVKSSKKC